jgi:V8-like Glu-specific endopeptidase
MQSRGVWIAGIAGLALLTAFLCGALGTAFVLDRRHGADEGPPPEALEPGGPHAGALDLPRVKERTFALEVPAHAVAVRVKLVSRGAELSLSARKDGHGDDRGDGGYDFAVGTDSGEAALSIGRFTDPPLSAGRWILRAAFTGDVVPTTPERKLLKIPFTIEASVFESRIDGELVPGTPLEGEVDGGSGGFRTYRIEVPKDASALRIDLSRVAGDLDLYAARGGPMIAFGDDVHFSRHPYGCESLVVEGGAHVEGGADTALGGTWYVDVVDPNDQDGATPFRIQASLSRDPPEALLRVPRLPASDPSSRRGSRPIAKLLPSVVEIETDDATGSGTILSEDGWILTNAHVVEKVGGGSFEDVVISATFDAREPPVETFRGKVERVDAESDLALLRVTSGFYGQPLPAGYRFPALARGDPAGLDVGDPIWLVGYPSTGGQGSRVTITCTRGVVSGFETAEFGFVIKTDANITNGNSGGAALDEEGKLVGVPTSMVELGSGQVAYVHPLSAMPEAWLTLLRR